MTFSALKLDAAPPSDLKVIHPGRESPETRQLLWSTLQRLTPLVFPLLSLSPDGTTLIGEERGDNLQRSLILMQNKGETVSNPLNCESVLRTIAEEYGVHLAAEFETGKTTFHMTNHFARASATAPTTELALADGLHQLIRSGIKPASPNGVHTLRKQGEEDWPLLSTVAQHYPENFHSQTENGITRTYFFSEHDTWILAAHRESDHATASSTTGILRALRELLLQNGSLSYALVAAHDLPHLWIWKSHKTTVAQGKTIWHPLATLLTQGEA